MGPSWLEAASITDGPGVEAEPSDMELHVSRMKTPAGMVRVALRPKDACWWLWETFMIQTGLPEEYSKEYL